MQFEQRQREHCGRVVRTSHTLELAKIAPICRPQNSETTTISRKASAPASECGIAGATGNRVMLHSTYHMCHQACREDHTPAREIGREPCHELGAGGERPLQNPHPGTQRGREKASILMETRKDGAWYQGPRQIRHSRGSQHAFARWVLTRSMAKRGARVRTPSGFLSGRGLDIYYELDR